jgi:hypothetical protein
MDVLAIGYSQLQLPGTFESMMDALPSTTKGAKVASGMSTVHLAASNSWHPDAPNPGSNGLPSLFEQAIEASNRLYVTDVVCLVGGVDAASEQHASMFIENATTLQYHLRNRLMNENLRFHWEGIPPIWEFHEIYHEQLRLLTTWTPNCFVFDCHDIWRGLDIWNSTQTMNDEGNSAWVDQTGTTALGHPLSYIHYNHRGRQRLGQRIAQSILTQ